MSSFKIAQAGLRFIFLSLLPLSYFHCKEFETEQEFPLSHQTLNIPSSSKPSNNSSGQFPCHTLKKSHMKAP